MIVYMGYHCMPSYIRGKVLVAQLVEHKTENLGVAGSSPV